MHDSLQGVNIIKYSGRKLVLQQYCGDMDDILNSKSHIK